MKNIKRRFLDKMAFKLTVSDNNSTLKKYLDLLYEANQELNLVSRNFSREDLQLHLEEIAFSVSLLKLPEGCLAIDCGTGAGLPGIPFAVTNPNAYLFLLDSNRKKVQFLNDVKSELQLENIVPLTDRVENLALNEKYFQNLDFAFSRAVAEISVSLEYLSYFLKVGGQAFLFKTDEQIIQEMPSKKCLDELHLDFCGSLVYGVDGKCKNRSILIFRKCGLLDSRFPRRDGIPLKRPL